MLVKHWKAATVFSSKEIGILHPGWYSTSLHNYKCYFNGSVKEQFVGSERWGEEIEDWIEDCKSDNHNFFIVPFFISFMNESIFIFTWVNDFYVRVWELSSILIKLNSSKEGYLLNKSYFLFYYKIVLFSNISISTSQLNFQCLKFDSATADNILHAADYSTLFLVSKAIPGVLYTPARAIRVSGRVFWDWVHFCPRPFIWRARDDSSERRSHEAS